MKRLNADSMALFADLLLIDVKNDQKMYFGCYR